MKFKGKTIEEAISKALNFLNVCREELEINIIQEPGKRLLGLINGKEAIIDVCLKKTSVEELLKEDISDNNISKNITNSINFIEKKIKIERIAKFLNEILKILNDSTEFTIKEENNFLFIDIKGNNVGSLIGKRGETLYSFQYLINLIANKNDEKRIKIILDIENFRKKREKTLQELAKRLANQVIKTKKSISLEPMHPIERKIIHIELQDNPKLETISYGIEGKRYIKILFKETPRIN